MRKNVLFRWMTACIAAVLLLGVPAKAAVPEPVQPNASSYISDHTTTISRPSGGAIKVKFEVEGIKVLTKLGAKSIKIYQSYNNNTWSLVKTYSSSTTSGMLASNTDYHNGSVTYSGYVGVYYKAYVQFYGQDSSGSDSVYEWTSVVLG